MHNTGTSSINSSYLYYERILYKERVFEQDFEKSSKKNKMNYSKYVRGIKSCKRKWSFIVKILIRVHSVTEELVMW